MLQIGQALKAGVGEARVVQVQAAQVGETRQIGLRQAALSTAEFPQLGESAERFDAFVIDIDAGGEVPADVEAFEVGEFGEALEDVVGVHIALAGVPDGAGQKEVSQMGEASQLDEFGGRHDGTGEVDTQDAHVARR